MTTKLQQAARCAGQAVLAAAINRGRTSPTPLMRMTRTTLRTITPTPAADGATSEATVYRCMSAKEVFPYSMVPASLIGIHACRFILKTTLPQALLQANSMGTQSSSSRCNWENFWDRNADRAGVLAGWCSPGVSILIPTPSSGLDHHDATASTDQCQGCSSTMMGRDLSERCNGFKGLDTGMAKQDSFVGTLAYGAG